MRTINNSSNLNSQKIVIPQSTRRPKTNWIIIIGSWLRRFKFLLLLAVIACLANSCEEFNCSFDNTAEIRFENRSKTETSFLIVLDGTILMKLEPGEISETYTINAGGHSFKFLHTDGVSNTCNPSFVNLKACDTKVFWCTY